MYIRATVTVGSKKEEIQPIGENKYHVCLREAAKENKANRRLIQVFEQYFKVPGKVSIVSGHRRPNKMLLIDLP